MPHNEHNSVRSCLSVSLSLSQCLSVSLRVSLTFHLSSLVCSRCLFTLSPHSATRCLFVVTRCHTTLSHTHTFATRCRPDSRAYLVSVGGSMTPVNPSGAPLATITYLDSMDEGEAVADGVGGKGGDSMYVHMSTCPRVHASTCTYMC